MIIHKTMEMPSSCTMCWIRSTCTEWMAERMKFKGYGQRLENCPLVEVKEEDYADSDKRETI